MSKDVSAGPATLHAGERLTLALVRADKPCDCDTRDVASDRPVFVRPARRLHHTVERHLHDGDELAHEVIAPTGAGSSRTLITYTNGGGPIDSARRRFISLRVTE